MIEEGKDKKEFTGLTRQNSSISRQSSVSWQDYQKNAASYEVDL